MVLARGGHSPASGKCVSGHRCLANFLYMERGASRIRHCSRG